MFGDWCFFFSHRRPKGLIHAKMSHGLTADGQAIFSDNEEEMGPLSPSQVSMFLCSYYFYV